MARPIDVKAYVPPGSLPAPPPPPSNVHEVLHGSVLDGALRLAGISGKQLADRLSVIADTSFPHYVITFVRKEGAMWFSPKWAKLVWTELFLAAARTGAPERQIAALRGLLKNAKA